MMPTPARSVRPSRLRPLCVCLFLLAAMNDVERLGTRANGLVANAFGLLVMGVASMLGLTALLMAYQNGFNKRIFR